MRSRAPITLCFLLLLSAISPVVSAQSEDDNKAKQDHVSYRKAFDWSPGDFEIDLDFPAGSPGDWENGENSGKLTRGWVENIFSYAEVEYFLATRQVLDHYEYEPSYARDGTDPFFSLSSVDWDLKDFDGQTLERLESPNEDWWLNYYCRYYTNGRAFDKEMVPNSFEEWPRGFRHFQGFSSWYRHSVRIEYEGKYYLPYVPHWWVFLCKIGKYKIPVYRDEEYTRWRTTVYQIKDWMIENWSIIEGTVTIRGLRGYDDDVQLSVQTDNELISTVLEDPIIHVSSENTVRLVISIDQELGDSDHRIVITALDDHGREEKLTYQLELETADKPPKENRIVEQWESDVKPSDPTEDYEWIPNGRCGVEGYVTGNGKKLEKWPDNLSVRIDGDRDASLRGNHYQEVWNGYIPPSNTHTFKITAKALGYWPQTGYATDEDWTYAIARKDFDLQPEGPP